MYPSLLTTRSTPPPLPRRLQQGQKLQAYTWLKGEISKKVKQQRYKHTIIVDLGGAGSGLLNGKRRNTIKKVIDIGGNYFPESLWKMYVINTPWVLKAGWSMVKPWIHPVTIAKINICGAPKDAIKKMQENDGCVIARHRCSSLSLCPDPRHAARRAQHHAAPRRAAPMPADMAGQPPLC